MQKQLWFFFTLFSSSHSSSYILKLWGMDVLNLNLTPYCHVSSHISHVLIFKRTTKEFRPHAQTHHIVIIVIVVIIAMPTLCHSIMSHATLIIFDHACMLTLQTYLGSVQCTLFLQSICRSRTQSYSRIYNILPLTSRNIMDYLLF